MSGNNLEDDIKFLTMIIIKQNDEIKQLKKDVEFLKNKIPNLNLHKISNNLNNLSVSYATLNKKK